MFLDNWMTVRTGIWPRDDMSAATLRWDSGAGIQKRRSGKAAIIFWILRPHFLKKWRQWQVWQLNQYIPKLPSPPSRASTGKERNQLYDNCPHFCNYEYCTHLLGGGYQNEYCSHLRACKERSWFIWSNTAAESAGGFPWRTTPNRRRLYATILSVRIASTEFGCTKFYVAWLRYRLSKHRVWVHTPQTHLLGSTP